MYPIEITACQWVDIRAQYLKESFLWYGGLLFELVVKSPFYMDSGIQEFRHQRNTKNKGTS